MDLSKSLTFNDTNSISSPMLFSLWLIDLVMFYVLFPTQNKHTEVATNGLELLDNISIVKLNHTHHGDTPATPSRRSDEWCTGLSLSVFALLIIQSIEWSSPTGISKTNVTEDASTLDRNLRVEKISLTLLLPRFSYIIRCMRLIHWTLLENISG